MTFTSLRRAIVAGVLLGSAAVSAATLPIRGYQPGEGIRIGLLDDEVEVQLHARLTLDGAFLFDEEGTRTEQELRRARVALSGRLGRDWRLRLAYEAGGLAPSWRDAWLRYDGFDSVRLRFGQFQESFSLDELTGSGDLLFAERAIPNVLVPGYHLGAEAALLRDRWHFTWGAFGGSLDRQGEGWGSSARLTAAPLLSDSNWLHLGVGASYREPGDGTMRFRPRPEIHLSDERLDTGRLRDIERTAAVGVELAGASGAASFQAEWIGRFLDLPTGAVRVDGGYLAAAWSLTGETRAYSPRTGRLRGLEPRRRVAWELAARLSYLDLDTSRTSSGRERNYTLGLNVYLGQYGRLLLNYVHADFLRDDSPTRGIDALVLQLQWRL